MAMGNLGENHELLAMKSAGMSLRRIMTPLFWVIGIISIGSFFLINDLVPHANKKMYTMLFDIKQQRPSLEFQDGLFFNGISGIGIRVDKQDPKTKLLTGVLIYDNRSHNNDVTTTLADSGYIRMTADKRYLLVTLMNGESFERKNANASGSQTKDVNKLTRSKFAHQEIRIPMDDVSGQQLDMASLNNNPITMDIADLERHIDTLDMQVNKLAISTYNPLLREHIFERDPDGIAPVDSLMVDRSHKIYPANFIDSVAKLDTRTKDRIYDNALRSASGSSHAFSVDEDMANKALVQLYRSNNEWHRKLTLPISILIFFLIGAPLGAIIRKGGFGMPIVISLIFFIVYYIISISGEKYAREGEWTSLLGMWIPIIVLTPLAIILTHKANNDSPLFNLDWYREGIKRIRKKLLRKRKKSKKHKMESTTNK
jgi:lipopolysaccharide export system permease protein